MNKRIFDLVVSILVLLILMPFLILIGCAIALNGPGSIFYSGIRIGRRGRPFKMYKFRTMDGRELNKGPRVTAFDDPRITRLGRFLRFTKINELPQLLNVIKGDMSLVGPRPEDPEFVRLYTAEESEILSMRPGITSPSSIIYYDEERLLSFAQASDDYISEILPRKLKLDLLYVRHHSFLLDLDVLYQTFIYFLPKMRKVVPEVDEILFGPIHRFARKYLPWFIIDWLIALTCMSTAGLVWRSRTPFELGILHAVFFVSVLAIAFSITNWITGLHRTYWKRATDTEILGITFSTAFAAAIVVIVNKYLFIRQIFPSGMILLGCFFSLTGFIVVRYWHSLAADLAKRFSLDDINEENKERILIIGAGETAGLVVHLMVKDPRAQNYQLVGFVDDDPSKARTRIMGFNVLGSTRRIPDIIDEFRVNAAILAISNIEIQRQRHILEMCYSLGISVVRFPDIAASLYEELELSCSSKWQANIGISGDRLERA